MDVIDHTKESCGLDPFYDVVLSFCRGTIVDEAFPRGVVARGVEGADEVESRGVEDEDCLDEDEDNRLNSRLNNRALRRGESNCADLSSETNSPRAARKPCGLPLGLGAPDVGTLVVDASAFDSGVGSQMTKYLGSVGSQAKYFLFSLT